MGTKFYVLQELFIKAKNAPGALKEVSQALSNKGINIESICAYANDSNAFFRIITTDALTAQKSLNSAPSVMNVSIENVLVMKISDRPGELAKITEKLSNSGVDLETVYILGKDKGLTELAVKPIAKHFEKAKSVLSE